MGDATGGGFPKYQYSVFQGKRREAQFVVRSDDLEEFKRLIRDVQWLTEHIGEEGLLQNTPADDELSNYTCKQCGAPADFRAGRSKRTGEPYKAIVCTTDTTHIERLA